MTIKGNSDPMWETNALLAIDTLAKIGSRAASLPDHLPAMTDTPPQPRVCESCRRRPAAARPTWTRQHGDRFLCSTCAMGY